MAGGRGLCSPGPRSLCLWTGCCTSAIEAEAVEQQGGRPWQLQCAGSCPVSWVHFQGCPAELCRRAEPTVTSLSSSFDINRSSAVLIFCRWPLGLRLLVTLETSERHLAMSVLPLLVEVPVEGRELQHIQSNSPVWCEHKLRAIQRSGHPAKGRAGLSSRQITKQRILVSVERLASLTSSQTLGFKQPHAVITVKVQSIPKEFVGNRLCA